MHTSRRRKSSMFVATLLLFLIGGGCTSDTTSGSGTAPELAPASAACFPEEGQSVARVWNEAILGAIRRDFPAPVVHARNLFHVSAAMWDAWAGYDPIATGYFVDETREAGDQVGDQAEDLTAARSVGNELRGLRGPRLTDTGMPSEGRRLLPSSRS